MAGVAEEEEPDEDKSDWADEETDEDIDGETDEDSIEEVEDYRNN